jgi:hypothetical protein
MISIKISPRSFSTGTVRYCLCLFAHSPRLLTFLSFLSHCRLQGGEAGGIWGEKLWEFIRVGRLGEALKSANQTSTLENLDKNSPCLHLCLPTDFLQLHTFRMSLPIHVCRIISDFIIHPNT